MAGLVLSGLTLCPVAADPPVGCDLIGTVGTPELGTDNTAAGLDGFPAAAVALPGQVYFRTTAETFNRRWSFATRDGAIYVKEAAAQGGWRALPLPGCLAGRITGVSADDDELMAIDRDGRFFTMDHILSAPADWNWSSRYGTPLWTGPGNTLPPARSTGPGRCCPRRRTRYGGTALGTTTMWAAPRSRTSSRSPTTATASTTWTRGCRRITATRCPPRPVVGSVRCRCPPAARPPSWW